MSRRRTKVSAIGLALCAVVVAFPLGGGAAAAEGAAAPSGRYVAFGDSYSADSGVMPIAKGTNPFCLQSARNYPKLVAAELGLTLVDVTCGGATVAHLSKPQYRGVPAQLDALNGDESVVTVGIGGNDNNLFASAIALCGAFAPIAVLDLGAPCQRTYGDRFDRLIASDAPAIGAALDAIRLRAPHAKVYVVGYLSILPQSGRCFRQMPLTTGDTAYMNAVQKNINTMLAEQAALHGATYIDTFTPSIGHDVCQPVGVRWIEPPLSGQPIHPGAVGAAAQARIVAATLAS
ncbi:SGNH/GDSL hydrolase family protein [Nocardioides marmoriginsengisoli]|uniref:SGNH/GDSL hydrolase family protein n=1 Tax=Nocardioides marmoriginsengisoli TaxID=661483 RepID=A0A3N0CHL3_9ACTN|nr:SGNH/GDSL hydrolase family protein [Nocardioides marmoriginsengisoli]RNL62942.1 SGNH/GDSL hydrolase family protein [Nocardioides marmoriginsengisoli]